MMRRVAVFASALAFAAIGPKISAPQDRPASRAFAYAPPEGFVETSEAPRSLEGEGAGHPNAAAWTDRRPGVHTFAPRVTVAHTNSRSPVEGADLARLAEGMPEVHASLGWSHRRHETRTRSDGARVGLIEGDCIRDREAAPGLPKVPVRFRMMQLVFPDDSGTSIVTAMYGADEATKYEAAFEATISTAEGVALRVPPPPPFVFFAWAAGGAALGWLAVSLFGKRTSAAVPASKAS